MINYFRLDKKIDNNPCYYSFEFKKFYINNKGRIYFILEEEYKKEYKSLCLILNDRNDFHRSKLNYLNRLYSKNRMLNKINSENLFDNKLLKTNHFINNRIVYCEEDHLINNYAVHQEKNMNKSNDEREEFLHNLGQNIDLPK
jgi:hypothetical protein